MGSEGESGTTAEPSSGGAVPKDGYVPASVSLAQLAIGEDCTVVGLAGEADNGVNRRLRDLGFLIGTRVLAVRRAPMGEPTIYELRGYQMSLRRAEAQRILIEPAHTP